MSASDALAHCVREVVDHVDTEGWGQPPQMFAFVPTADLVVAEPSLHDRLADGAVLTVIAQDPLPADVDGGSPALDEFLATTSWPAAVAGCALVQEIVVLPPEAEADLEGAVAPVLTDRDGADHAARLAARAHPDRRDGRLIVAVLRDGPSISLLQLRPEHHAENDDAENDHAETADEAPELLTYEDLAPGVVAALHSTFDEQDEF